MGLLDRGRTVAGSFDDAVGRMHRAGRYGDAPNPTARSAARDEALELLKAVPLQELRQRIATLHADPRMLATGVDIRKRDEKSRVVDALDVLTARAAMIEDTPPATQTRIARALLDAPAGEVGGLAEASGMGISEKQMSARILRYHGMDAFQGPYKAATRALRDKRAELDPKIQALTGKARMTAEDHTALRDLQNDLAPFEAAVNEWTHSVSDAYKGEPLARAELADNGELAAS